MSDLKSEIRNIILQISHNEYVSKGIIVSKLYSREVDEASQAIVTHIEKAGGVIK